MSGVVSSPAYPVSIFIAGDYDAAVASCQRYCDAVGLCVTVERCVYVYTGGQEDGVRVGVINYPRFPKTPEELDEIATDGCALPYGKKASRLRHRAALTGTRGAGRPRPMVDRAKHRPLTFIDGGRGQGHDRRPLIIIDGRNFKRDYAPPPPSSPVARRIAAKRLAFELVLMLGELVGVCLIMASIIMLAVGLAPQG